MKKIEKDIIMVFGTFDVLHKGHLNFFKQARKLSKNPCFVVSVARDINVKKIKGSKPSLSEKERMQELNKLLIVDKVVLGGKDNYINHILKESPKFIALGYDQKEYTKDLKVNLTKKGLNVTVVRLKSHLPNKYKSSIIKKLSKSA